MPVRWTADNDHLLLVTLLETHNINVKGNLIRNAWPKDGREIPSVRAITERIVKIRFLAKEAAKKSAQNPHTPPSSPRNKKRKKSINEDEEDEPAQQLHALENSTIPPTAKKPRPVRACKATSKTKTEEQDSGEDEDGEDGAPESSGMVDETLDEIETSEDEYCPGKENDDYE